MKKKKIILIAVSLAILAGGGDIGVGNRHRNYRTGNRSRSRYTGIRNYRQNLCGL